VNFVAFDISMAHITDSVNIKIYDDNGVDNKPGNLLLNNMKIACNDDELFNSTYNANYWYKIDLTDKDIIIENGSFYVSVEWITSNSPEIGIDTQDPNEYRTWIYEGNEWNLLSEVYPSFSNNQAMIRVLGIVNNKGLLKELSYDDGMPDKSCFQQVIGDKIAVKYTPLAYPCQLLGSFINITNYGSGNETDSIKLQVYNDNNGPNDIIASKVIRNTFNAAPSTTANTWYFVDLSEDSLIFDSGNFFIALEWLVSSSPEIGNDNENINNDRVWIYENSEWTILSEKYPEASNELMMVTALCNYDSIPREPVSIDNISYNNSLNIYPNPSKGYIYLDLKSASFGQGIDVAIINQMGERVLHKKGYNDNYLDISNLREGVYIIIVQTKEETMTHKLIKY